MLLNEYSSVFNTIVPSKLITKLRILGLNTSICNWILDFLTGCHQVVRVGNNTSAMLILNTGAPQGCILSLLLFSLFTHDCMAKHDSNTNIKIADELGGQREEVRDLAVWCKDNNISLNVIKAKEMIVDYRKRRTKHPFSLTGP
jgi:hypothetical protein